MYDSSPTSVSIGVLFKFDLHNSIFRSTQFYQSNANTPVHKITYLTSLILFIK